MDSDLTEIEKKEIQDRPPPHKNLTKEQYDLRKVIANKCHILCYEDTKKLHPELAEVYLKYPISKFYTNKDHRVMRRIYDLMETDTGYRAEAVTAFIMINNSPINGVSVDDLVPLDDWEQEHLDRLTSGLISDSEVFTDPLGFLPLLYNNSK
jgi:hypothetical protein